MNQTIKDNKGCIDNDIRNIEIDDAFESVTGSKVLCNFLIRTKNGLRKYRIVRTSNEKYVMQI